MATNLRLLALTAIFVLGLTQPLLAQRVSDTAEGQAAAGQAAEKAAPAAQAEPQETFHSFARKVGTFGPAKVNIRDQAELDLPKGYIFVPEKSAAEIMREMDNSVDESFVGMIFPSEESVWMANKWYVTVDYQKSGYIKDDDAKSWKQEDLLDDIKKSTEAHNGEMRAQGRKEMDILGWIERPDYDNATHRLYWSVAARYKGETDNEKNFINYRTMMLGREGNITLVMASFLSRINENKIIAKQLLENLNFLPGKRYSDFNASTDKVAEYGLAALVAGVAAKKLGLFAVAAAFAAKFAKVLILAAIGLLSGLRKMLGGKKAAQAPAQIEAPTAEPSNDKGDAA